jgi:hypothetical protein
MSWKIVPWRLGCSKSSSKVHHGNRQDAREGGEIPPLPRNCERPCPDTRPFGSSDVGRISAWVVANSAQDSKKPLKANPLGLLLGRWLKQA